MKPAQIDLLVLLAEPGRALLQGRGHVTPQHVKDVAHDVLRHRLLLNYEGQAQGVSTDDVIAQILERVPVP